MRTNLITICYPVAICSQGCHNGGTCVSPDICSCVTGWEGNDCKRGKCESATKATHSLVLSY